MTAISTVCAFSLLSCAKLPRVETIEQLEPAGAYAYYALPRLVALASFEVSSVLVDDTAPCRDEADLLADLGIELKRPGTYFGLSEARLSKRAEADPKHWYGVDLRGQSVKTVGLELGPDGRISGAHAASVGSGASTLGSVLQVTGELAGKVLFGNTEPAPQQDFCSRKADEIRDLRMEKRRLLDAGAPPHDAEALALKLARLELAEEAATAHFTGMRTRRPWTFRCEIVPLKNSAGNWETEIELFRFSKARGLLGFDGERCNLPPALAAPQLGLREKPKSVVAKPSQAIDGGESTVRLRLRKVTELSDVAEKLSPKKPETDASFAYRVPALADVWVEESGKTPRALTDKSRWLIPQLGEVLRLPRMKTGGRSAIELAFDPETGALLRIATAQEGADLGSVASSAAAGIQATLDARDAALARDPELSKAEREREYYEALAAVKVAKDILADAPNE
jgi:hypothetical protein